MVLILFPIETYTTCNDQKNAECHLMGHEMLDWFSQALLDISFSSGLLDAADCVQTAII